MTPLSKSHVALICSCLFSLPCLAQISIQATPDHPNGVYRENEPIHWQVKLSGKGAETIDKLTYTVKSGGLKPIDTGTVTLTDGKGTLNSTLAESGTLLVSLESADKSVKGAAGAVVAPEKLKPGAPCPNDFDAFWKAKFKELEAVPPNAELKPEPSGKEGVDYSKVTLDNVRGSHVQGQLARPTQGTKFPAILQLQYAGVYPLQKAWVTERAAKGWLILNIMAHDLPIDESEAFYKAQADGPLKNYTNIGFENRDTSYFVTMFQRCREAAEYLASRPDWDGKTFVVMGTSQGGLQSFVTGAFFPKTTAVIVEVPAGCDPSANAAGRAFGWPYWAGSHSEKAMQASRYFDAAHFAARLKCPLLVGVGLLDPTAPAGCVYAAYNQAPGPKEIVPMPLGDHRSGHGAFSKRREDWLNALAGGGAAPIAKSTE